MRILLTTHAMPSHLRPLVPIAQAALKAGHTVAVAAPDSLVAELRASGLDHLPAGVDMMAELPQLLAESGLRFEDLAAPHRAADLLGGPAMTMAQAVLTSDWRPDVIVRTALEPGGALAAERLGIPHAAVAICGGVAEYYGPKTFVSALAPHRDALGLPPDPAGVASFRYLNVCLTPEAYDPAELAVPNTRCYRHENPGTAADQIPSFVPRFRGDRPRILASLGTIAPHAAEGHRRLLQAVVDALSVIDCDAIVATGRGAPASEFGNVPAHVQLVEYVPQPELLVTCDLFVTHAGHNSVRETLRAGTPVVAVPMFAEQPYNAVRCAAVGVGEAIPASMASATLIAEACRQVLADPCYQQRTQQLCADMMSLPSLEVFIDDLVGLASAQVIDGHAA
jgi:N-glycosyltransferase